MKECFLNKGKVYLRLDYPQEVSLKKTFWVAAVWPDLVDIHMKINQGSKII
jgi:hypothetical protein